MIKKVIIIAFIFTIILTVSGCSLLKNSSGRPKTSSSTSRLDPVSRKEKPLPKKFILKGKKRSIIGQGK
jgi:hypothetical protein